MNLTSLFQGYNSVAIATFGAYWELKPLSDVEATLPRKSDVVRSMLRRGCKFDVEISTLQQRCQYSIHGIFGHELTIQHRGNIGATL